MERLTSVIKLRLKNQGIECIYNSHFPDELLIPTSDRRYPTPSIFNHAAIIVKPNQIALTNINSDTKDLYWLKQLSTSDPELLNKIDKWVSNLSEVDGHAIIGEAPPVPT